MRDCVAGIGPDLSPHYHLNLQSHYRPGLSQGLNTGVVFYQLERMRSSQEYNNYLELESVTALQRKYQYKSVLTSLIAQFTETLPSPSQLLPGRAGLVYQPRLGGAALVLHPALLF